MQEITPSYQMDMLFPFQPNSTFWVRERESDFLFLFYQTFNLNVDLDLYFCSQRSRLIMFLVKVKVLPASTNLTLKFCYMLFKTVI